MIHSLFIDMAPDDLNEYRKLDAACTNLQMVRDYGKVLLKRGTDKQPWSRGSVYVYQSAFVTAMLVTYGRVFTGEQTMMKFISIYGEQERAQHKRFMELRHEVYAHTDKKSHQVRPLHGDHISDMKAFVWHNLPADRVTKLMEMCSKMIAAFQEKQFEIKRRYSPIPGQSD